MKDTYYATINHVIMRAIMTINKNDGHISSHVLVRELSFAAKLSVEIGHASSL